MTKAAKSSKPETVIIVRDRRQPHQFSVHNIVIDQWLPIIGATGLAIYSLYVRMANRVDERCFPGYSLIQAHLGISASTLADYNRLLVWCGLLYIEPGDEKRSNNYYLLDVPEATPEALREIARRIRTELPKSNKLKGTFLQRVKAWQPLQAHFGDRSRVTAVVPSQISLPIGGTTATEVGASATEVGTTAAEGGASVSKAGASATEEEQSEGNNPNSNNPKITIRKKQQEHTDDQRETASSSATNNDSDAEQKAAFEAAWSVGIRGKKAESISRLEWATPHYIKAIVADTLERGDTVGMAIRRIEDADREPWYCEGCKSLSGQHKSRCPVYAAQVDDDWHQECDKNGLCHRCRAWPCECEGQEPDYGHDYQPSPLLDQAPPLYVRPRGRR